jgi:hypothetical protein
MNDRTQTAGSRVPIWRKTRTQKVDEKVEGLFESYRFIDQALVQAKKAQQSRPVGETESLVNKYF